MKEIDLTEKGKTIIHLEEIALRDNKGKELDFNFQPIYELGRYVSEGDKEFSKMLNLNQIACDDKPYLKENILNFFEVLSEKILTEQLGFAPVVIDFVVFDPEDKKGERFHIALCSTSAKIIEKYVDEVQTNIDGNIPGKKDQERGPILTNSEIYKSPYFYRGPNQRNLTDPALFHAIERNEMQIFFGTFKAKRENKVPIEAQKAHIEIFFDEIEKMLKEGEGLISKKGSNYKVQKEFEFNTSLLIPLLRPAASYDGDKNFRLRGGGLFVYGHTSKDAIIPELVSRLQHFFYRNILNESHTQITVDFFRHGNTNDLIHDFKGFISSQVVNGLDYILKQNHLNSKAHEQLLRIKNGSEIFIQEYKELLEAYRDFIRDDAKLHFLTGNNLKLLVERLGKDYEGKLMLTSTATDKDDTIKIRANEKILKKIFRNLLNNSLSEYESQNINISDRKIVVSWIIDNDKKVMTIIILNTSLFMDEDIIDDFGLRPLNTNGTGLGGYFINNTLGWMLAEENKMENEKEKNIKRYIKVKNDTTGVQFSFKFKIQ